MDADELTDLVRKHVTQIRVTVLKLPFYEVRSEQTTATPAAATGKRPEDFFLKKKRMTCLHE